MPETFVKLPSGDWQIEHIRKKVALLKNIHFEFKKWEPLPALLDKNGSIRLYTGQKFDSKYFKLDANGWTHEHCEICTRKISAEQNEESDNEGYCHNFTWICKSCYETLFIPDNLEEKLSTFEQYKK